MERYGSPIDFNHPTNFFEALAKFAQIVYTLHDFVGNTALAQAGLNTLKQNFAVFINNQQQYPLVYECRLLILSNRIRKTNDKQPLGEVSSPAHHTRLEIQVLISETPTIMIITFIIPTSYTQLPLSDTWIRPGWQAIKPI